MKRQRSSAGLLNKANQNIISEFYMTVCSSAPLDEAMEKAIIKELRSRFPMLKITDAHQWLIRQLADALFIAVREP